MDQNLNKKWIIYALVFLLVLNISALGTIVYLTYRPHHELLPPGSDGPMGKAMEKELNLDSDQRIAFKKLRQDFFNETKPVLDSLKTKREEIFKGLSESKPDTVKLFKTADEFGQLHGKLKKMAIKHFINVQSGCNPEQCKQLCRMYRQILEADGPGRTRPHRHRIGD